jgi:hypothetical protein
MSCAAFAQHSTAQDTAQGTAQDATAVTAQDTTHKHLVSKPGAALAQHCLVCWHACDDGAGHVRSAG